MQREKIMQLREPAARLSTEPDKVQDNYAGHTGI
jgi:hypothetical protein